MSAQGIVQYILVRSDLCKTLGWPVGALVAQACHASTAAIHMFYDHEDTKKYLSDLDNMHKIILSVSIILNPNTRKNPINYCFDGIGISTKILNNGLLSSKKYSNRATSVYVLMEICHK